MTYLLGTLGANYKSRYFLFCPVPATQLPSLPVLVLLRVPASVSHKPGVGRWVTGPDVPVLGFDGPSNAHAGREHIGGPVWLKADTII